MGSPEGSSHPLSSTMPTEYTGGCGSARSWHRNFTSAAHLPCLSEQVVIFKKCWQTHGITFQDPSEKPTVATWAKCVIITASRWIHVLVFSILLKNVTINYGKGIPVKMAFGQRQRDLLNFTSDVRGLKNKRHYILYKKERRWEIQLCFFEKQSNW